MRNYILKRVEDKDEANDILHDVLMKVYNFCMTRSGVNNVRSWLFQISHNTIVDSIRKKKTGSRTLSVWIGSLFTHGTATVCGEGINARLAPEVMEQWTGNDGKNAAMPFEETKVAGYF